jgi:hypothetical protein
VFSDSFIEFINEKSPGVVVFSVVRNELLRLRAFLKHYRAMGIRLFVIVDNGSEDGTFEYLQEQRDVLLVQTLESYAASNFGLHWLNDLHRKLADKCWILFADADELLVYRGWPKKPVADLCAEAETQGSNAIFAPMLDMYPNGPLESAETTGEDNLFAVSPCFDRDICFRLRPVKPWEKPFKSIEIIGGPRIRMISNFKKEINTGWGTYFIRGQIDRFLRVTPDILLPWLIRIWPKQPPALAKIPLAMSGTGVAYSTAHGGDGWRFHAENAVVCHFKFLADFPARVNSEASRGEHYRRGAEYIAYAHALQRYGQIDLRYEGTEIFESVDQLQGLGFFRDIHALLAGEVRRSASSKQHKARQLQKGVV